MNVIRNALIYFVLALCTCLTLTRKAYADISSPVPGNISILAFAAFGMLIGGVCIVSIVVVVLIKRKNGKGN